jgi:hypothetical protein
MNTIEIKPKKFEYRVYIHSVELFDRIISRFLIITMRKESVIPMGNSEKCKPLSVGSYDFHS